MISPVIGDPGAMSGPENPGGCGCLQMALHGVSGGKQIPVGKIEDPEAGQPMGGRSLVGVLLEVHDPVVGPSQPEGALQERGLTRSVPPQESRDAPRVAPQGGTLEHL